MIKADFHVHSHFSSDSEADTESIILSAITKGLNTICITEHNDFDFPLNENGEVEYLLDTQSYRAKLFELREKYKSKIEVLFGVELGLMPYLAQRCTDFVNANDFDFVIGSSHLCNGLDPYYSDFWATRTDEQGCGEYFTAVSDCVKSCNCFDVYGHLDYIVRYGHSKTYNPADFSDIIDEILRLLIAGGKGIEINAGGLRHGLEQANPHEAVLKRYRELGGEIITVGSDSHTESDVAYRFDRAEEILLNCGFKYYSVFRQRKPQMIKI